MLNRCEKRFPAELSELDHVLDFASSRLEAADCPMKVITSISISLEEAFVNVASYAYPNGKGEADLSVEIDDAAHCVCITLSDEGIPFDPLKKDDPDISLGAEKRKIGGLGILMIKKMMDAVDYEYKDGRNILSMKKSFE